MAGTINLNGKDLNYEEAAAAYASGKISPPNPPGREQLTVDQALANVFPEEHAAAKSATGTVAEVAEAAAEFQASDKVKEQVADHLGIDPSVLAGMSDTEIKAKLDKFQDKKAELAKLKDISVGVGIRNKFGEDESKWSADGMARPFAGQYPSTIGEEGTKDFILFSAYSNDVAGYTKMETIGEGASGNTELEGSIQLYIPENLAVNSAVGYRNTEGGSAAALGGNLFGAEGDDGFVTTSLFGQLFGTAVAQVGDNGAVIAQTLGAGLGAANRTVLFEGVEFRTFSYAYEFLPKSWKESHMLKDIIKFFRIQMLPAIKVNGNTFKPPNYFTIEYMINGQPTDYLNKIKPCVCTGCDVSYGGNGQFAMFQSEKGEEPAPALINLTLTFQEIQVVSKADALEGY